MPKYRAFIKGKGTREDPYVTPRLPPGSRIVERRGNEIIFEYDGHLEGYEVVRTRKGNKGTSRKGTSRRRRKTTKASGGGK